MRIAMIGSTAYEERMKKHRDDMIYKGHEIKIPALDNLGANELGICKYNLEMIEWADEVHLIWDGRSIGTVFDLGMTFALKKKLVIVYINPKKFLNFVEQYASLFEGW